ncbi:hypothetical protein BB934_32160 (plasmid) [Microvirga ossetica]|uniref:Uncharacterized protein n=1 Tax=Microvirga ossetica TaxID=1882682 RepID=A0A1B2ESD4_9HYPH|nr:hypothetical protein BB934_32160 [Microvirga ossetica]
MLPFIASTAMNGALENGFPMPSKEMTVGSENRCLIPTGADPHAFAQSRRPMDLMVQGWLVSLFDHAS